MRLCVLGDIHLFSLSVRARQLAGKRLLAHTNLLLNRRHRFMHAVLPAVIDKVVTREPELLLLSGDVTTSSLQHEFEDLRRYLAPLSAVVPMVLVPGNHDRYTFRSHRTKRMEQLLGPMMPPAWPYHRILTDRWSLLALDTAVPNRVWSRGRMGTQQTADALRLIENVPRDHGLVVLAHYPCALPPRVPRGWTHDLAEARVLREALERCPGRVMFIHGHVHRPWYALPEHNGHSKPPFLCVNAGAPCLTSDRYPLGQGFWELNLPEDPQDPVAAVHHVPVRAPSEGAVLDASAEELTWTQTTYPESR